MVTIALTKKQVEIWTQTLELISTLEINPAPEDKQALAIISAKLEYAHLEEYQPSELLEARELLADMVVQNCVERDAPHRMMSYAISTNECALAYFEKIGWAKRLFGRLERWIWTEKAYKE